MFQEHLFSSSRQIRWACSRNHGRRRDIQQPCPVLADLVVASLYWQDTGMRTQIQIVGSARIENYK